MPDKLVLTLNCGSSSIKFEIINPETLEETMVGLAEKIGTDDATLEWEFNGKQETKSLGSVDYPTAIQSIFEIIESVDGLSDQLMGVGHRVAHGGEHFKSSAIMNDENLDILKRYTELAPLHNPANLAGIEAAREAFPNLKQVAVFDTSFHQSLPDYAYLYAIPYSLYKDHDIRRYGFHGTSHRYVTTETAKRLETPIEKTAFLSAHLGNGCSAAAVLNGKSVDTTMGMTPLEGLVMGTRSGDIDPGLHAHLAEKLNLSIQEVTDLLNKKSGLLGLSELSMDMRTLSEAAKKGNKQAALAIEVFCYRLAKTLAALAIPLGRIDALIFTGGIGEHQATVRAKVLEWLKPLGFHIDNDRNQHHGADTDGLITTDAGTKAYVIPTHEAWLIAKDVLELLK